MKTSSMLTFLALASVSLISARTFSSAPLEERGFRGHLYEVVTTEALSFDKFPGANDSKATGVLSKRTLQDNLTHYNNLYPRNRIPSWVVTNDYRSGTHTRIYSALDIWRSMEAAYGYLRTGNQAVTNAWPIANARYYPTYFGGQDAEIGLRNVRFGQVASPPTMYEYPLLEGTDIGPWRGGARRVGTERVLLTAGGLYLGVITHRGLGGNGYHWGYPSNNQGNFQDGYSNGNNFIAFSGVPPPGPNRAPPTHGFVRSSGR
ncbi:hypothetical protein LTR17_018395 [Elasticomyces elasticus]|nr:hypothetical protein LTR17_018395 [Elasticomyces elasticus]